MISRRRFVTTASASLLASPIAAEAQKVYRVGMLFQGLPSAPGLSGILVKTLSDSGYIEGRNIVFDRRGAEGKSERFSSLAAELVALKPDAIVADTTPAVIAAMRATTTIPIVMMNVADPLTSGLVSSLARPGGNVTGVADLATDMGVKGVELLHAVAPKTTRLAVLMSDNPAHPPMLKAIQDAATGVGLTVLPTKVRAPEEFEGAFASMVKQNAGALIVLGGAPLNSSQSERDKLVALALKNKLPTFARARGWPDSGGLLSYGPPLAPRLRLATAYVEKILKGAKPGDLPVQQVTEFELVINLKTAKALGLTIPQSVLIRANEVIE
jgi:putative tryptophan/tyrosine transport system substrate-binding protein